jgi:hypothetical protein
MPSPLDIYFSAQQLCFVAEYRELCVATESLASWKYYGSHDLHTLPSLSVRRTLIFFPDCVSTKVFEIFEVLKELVFFLRK